jgi:putative transcriptional regulator
MKNNQIYDSEILAAIHETVSDLYEAELLDSSTKKEFDELCLTSIKSFKPDEIKAIRLKENLSQEVFANYLNVSPQLIYEWEKGKKQPHGSSLKLLNIVQKKVISILI